MTSPTGVSSTVFALDGEGFARVAPELVAYRAIQPRTREVRHALRGLLTEASPEGRLYAALLLGEDDDAEGAAAWSRLATCRNEVTIHSGGCHVRINGGVGEVAADAALLGIQQAVEQALVRWRIAMGIDQRA